MSYITIILLILIIIVFYLYEELKNEYNTKCIDLNFWKNKYEKHHNKLNKLLKNIQIYLDKHKIKYWAHAGTLLGTVRHGGFIPWDDDVDLGYLNELDSNNKEIILNALNEINSQGYIVEKEYSIGYKIYDPNDKKVFIDMFEFNIENDMAKQKFKANLMWPNENYLLNELFPTKKVKFEDFEIPVPLESEKFCIRAFGKDYMNIFYIKFPHVDMFIDNLKDGIGIYLICNKRYYITQLKK